MRLVLSLICFLFATIETAAAGNTDTSPPSAMYASNSADLCRQYLPSWTDDEQRVWTAVCTLGQFGIPESTGGIEAVISADFLQTILVTFPYQKATSETGMILHNVQIIGHFVFKATIYQV
jgi:hypothetical protein